MFWATGTSVAIRASLPIEMSHFASSAQARTALPMCAETGPRRGAGRLKSAVNCWPDVIVKRQSRLAEGQLLERVAADLHPLLAARDVALAVALLLRSAPAR